MSSSDASSSASSSTSEKRGVKRKRNAVQAVSGSADSKIKKTAPQDASDSSDSGSDDSESDTEEKEEGEQEVEVLSHAAQRKLKRKAERAAKNPSSVSEKPQDAPPKRQNSVWVGNLAFKTTEPALRAFFHGRMPGCEVTRVNLPTKTGSEVGGGKGMRGENRGFAYVDFVTKEAKEQAIALSEQNLDGRKLLIKDGGDFTGRPAIVATTTESAATAGVTSAVGKSKTAQRILAAQKQPPAPTLFLGNLGFQATEESIRGMIEGHMKTRRKEGPKEGSNEEAKGGDAGGEEKPEEPKEKKWLRKVRLGTFEDSGLCKGWAFVDFVTIEDATTVLLDPRNHHLDGRKLVVEYASAEAVRRGGGPGAKAHRDKMEGNEKGKSGGRRSGKSERGEYKSEERPKKVSARDKPEGDDEDEGEDGRPTKRWKRADEREERGGKKRPRPGAALALAQREKVAIVPSSGKKIVF